MLNLTPAGGVDEAVAAALTESLATELSQRHLFQVISSRDVATVLGLERQRQLLGCSEDASACMTELAGALGARFVLSGSLAKLGDAYQLNLQTLDSRNAQPVGRATRIASDLGELRRSLPWALADATGIPAPEAPSHLGAYSLVGAGAALVVGGALFGVQGWSQEEALRQELRLGSEGKAQLDSLELYRDRAQRATRDQTIGTAAAAVGLGLVAGGVLWSRALDAPSSSGSSSVALVPTGSGLAVAGVLP